MRPLLRPLGVVVALGWLAQPALAQEGLGSGPAPAAEAVAASGATTRVPGQVSMSTEPRRDGQTAALEHVTVSVPASGPEVSYVFSSGGGTIYAARLLNERFQREAQAELAGVPAEKVAAGPIDLITPWSSGSLPFKVVFKDLVAVDLVTRIVRRANAGTVKDGRIVAPTEAEAKGFTVNRPVFEGDLVTITAPPTVAGDYKVMRVGPGGSIEPSPALPAKDAAGVAYEVKRVGEFRALFEQDPYFTRVSVDPGLPITYVWPDPRVDSSPLFIEKTFTVGKNPYNLDLAVTLYNFGDKPVVALPGLRVTGWQHPEAGGGSMFRPPTNILGASCRTNEALEHNAFPSLQESALENLQNGQGAIATLSFTTPTDFVAVDTNYFVTLAAPKTRAASGQCQQGAQIFDPNVPGAWAMHASYYVSANQTLKPGAGACVPKWWVARQAGARECGAAYSALGLADGASAKDVEASWGVLRNQGGADVSALDKAREEIMRSRDGSLRYDYTLFNGPKDRVLLAETHPVIDEVVNLGMFAFIAKPLQSLLVWLHGGVGSWALAIILLTFLVKLVLLPLTNKSYQSMQKMQTLKPKLDELKRKYANDKQKFAQEQMALFKREGATPLSGCFPMLLQMPVWFGLYQSILTSVELYHAPMGLWVHDLSAPDPYFVMPILLGGLMYVQTALTASTATMDGMQAKIMKYGMPILFSVFMLFLPSGLVLYIFVNVALTIVQNLVIKRRMNKT